jgi:hypothetical protein
MRSQAMAQMAPMEMRYAAVVAAPEAAPQRWDRLRAARSQRAAMEATRDSPAAAVAAAAMLLRPLRRAPSRQVTAAAVTTH